MSQGCTIVPLTPDRFSEFTRLIIALAEFEQLTPPDDAAFERMNKHAFGTRPKFEAYLAFIDETAVGYAIVFETYSSFLAKPTLYLEDLFVLPEFRARKIGYSLFTFIAAEAIRRDCGRMEWQVLDWNEHALRFYDKLGANHLNGWLPYRLTEDGLRAIVAQSEVFS